MTCWSGEGGCWWQVCSTREPDYLHLGPTHYPNQPQGRKGQGSGVDRSISGSSNVWGVGKSLTQGRGGLHWGGPGDCARPGGKKRWISHIQVGRRRHGEVRAKGGTLYDMVPGIEWE